MNDKVLTSEEFDPTPLDLGRRLKEILDEKGVAFSVPAFSKRIGMSESTLYRCLSGERYFKPSELEKVAEGLNISVARLKREDTRRKFIMLQAQVQRRINHFQALELALELLPSAIGCTERFEILNSLGAIYYNTKKNKQARNIWSEALPLAEKILSDFGEYRPLNMVINNLILTNTNLHDYSTLQTLLHKIEKLFDQFPPRLKGTLCYSQAITALNMGDTEEYEAKMYEQLEHFQLTQSSELVSFALHNVGYMLYKLGDFQKSKDTFEEAIAHNLAHPELATTELMFITKKALAKTLYKLKEKEESIKLITATLVDVKESAYYEVKGKLHLLLSLYTNSPQGAETVLSIEEVGRQLHLLACEFLTSYYSKIGDVHSLMKYYKLGETFGRSPISQMEEKI